MKKRQGEADASGLMADMATGLRESSLCWKPLQGKAHIVAQCTNAAALSRELHGRRMFECEFVDVRSVFAKESCE